MTRPAIDTQDTISGTAGQTGFFQPIVLSGVVSRRGGLPKAAYRGFSCRNFSVIAFRPRRSRRRDGLPAAQAFAAGCESITPAVPTWSRAT